MSSKHYEFRLVESADAADFERQLTEAGREGWSPAGYGVLPSGARSALLNRKVKHGKHHDHRPDRDRWRHTPDSEAEH